ncbi:DUF3099 domain-containing protein [Nakamurella flavida]|uniref:DUF3099 domain-containing protein n=1 Tax=Nakamurella flavida TaxID=363630 RepID=A0A938YMV9_9ACTN|nr:DUF3099 domain-containing protein [Nakamurella flavida]MBM9477476.1 DUF3099 domain-containing protein [Nakamurella flavida]MDP9777409.1 hypothetical protein [Nakamurella flavida]
MSTAAQDDRSTSGPEQGADGPYRSDDGSFVYETSHSSKQARKLRMSAAERRAETTVITEVEASYDEQLARRRKRYLLTMSLRVPLLVIAAMLYQTPWLAVLVIAVSIPLPWCAVLIANDRAPRKRHPAPAPVATVDPERGLAGQRKQLSSAIVVDGTTGDTANR